MSLVVNRRFYLKTYQWRVGVSSGTYSYVTDSSLGRSGWDRNPDPHIELVIPGAATNATQEINTGKKLEGFIEVIDWEAVKQLLYTIDVDNDTGGTQTAILANNSRTIIDYFVIVVYNIQIVNSTDVRTTPQAAFSFTNTVIRDVEYPTVNNPNDPIKVTFYADSVTETVA